MKSFGVRPTYSVLINTCFFIIENIRILPDPTNDLGEVIQMRIIWYTQKIPFILHEWQHHEGKGRLTSRVGYCPMIFSIKFGFTFWERSPRVQITSTFEILWSYKECPFVLLRWENDLHTVTLGNMCYDLICRVQVISSYLILVIIPIGYM